LAPGTAIAGRIGQSINALFRKTLFDAAQGKEKQDFVHRRCLTALFRHL